MADFREQGMTDIEQAEVAVKNAQQRMVAASNDLDEARKRLEAAKNPPKPKTVGERLAARYIFQNCEDETWGPSCGGGVKYVPTEDSGVDEDSDDDLADCRKYLAELVDEAVADEREACAKMVAEAGQAMRWITWADAAKAIRARSNQS